MRHLCDNNVLVAAVADSHPHHVVARRWLNSLNREDSAAFCRATQSSFLRILTLESALREDVRTNAQAIIVMEELLRRPDFEFVGSEPPDLEARWLDFARVKTPSPNIWMDAYLAAFAVGLRMRFVTFDKGFERYRKHGLDLLVLKQG